MDRERNAITDELKAAGADQVHFSDDHGYLTGVAVVRDGARTAQAWRRDYDGTAEAVGKLKEWLAARKGE